MQSEPLTRRRFIKSAGAATGGVLLGSRTASSQSPMTMPQGPGSTCGAVGAIACACAMPATTCIRCTSTGTVSN